MFVLPKIQYSNNNNINNKSPSICYYQPLYATEKGLFITTDVCKSDNCNLETGFVTCNKNMILLTHHRKYKQKPGEQHLM